MKKKNSYLTLLAAIAILLISVFVSVKTAKRIQADDYALKIDAAQRTQVCMNAVKGYKEELGLSISPEDLHGTGMLGDEFSGITTTVGVVDAKRTTANPDMAAMIVQMLEEAGIKSGDTVGAAFSGSFPAWNIATLCACAAMEVNLVYIASAGSSMYGANQIDLTFPDMVMRLADDGLIPQYPVAMSLGGDWDCGMEMDPEAVEALLPHLRAYGIPFIYEEDFAKNLALRQQVYEDNGPISVFFGVGGNVTTIGRGEDTMPRGVVRPYTVKTVTDESGLLDYYNANGMTVIHLLNVKEMVADYGLAYDPETLLPIGQAAVYYQTAYSKGYIAAGLALSLGLLFYDRYRRKKENETA